MGKLDPFIKGRHLLGFCKRAQRLRWNWPKISMENIFEIHVEKIKKEPFFSEECNANILLIVVQQLWPNSYVRNSPH
jgi:hypothetical protein